MIPASSSTLISIILEIQISISRISF
ncbi:hypothetical protein AT5G46085 [Arabidopsis thaliana]|uniref:Uncharacterized protein n=1 Tax=Arabidopsis thaliana TaxID=3702 RepID=A0A1P8B9F1_ARATH|nr:uncharacterized protein AT5G46085 [Arabidopsis thaliana]ANM68210.1 hypothetical protein AT5G46085 [Arabidopsis thaliana]|eukprot:NP_001329983.1 hypothetical protein AT5G46085 [Arabidopsis thaliana]